MHIFELRKLYLKPENTLRYFWLCFINATEREEFEMLKEKDPEIKKAVLLLEELSEDEETRRIAFIRDMAMRDEYDRYMTAKRIGKEEGFKEGETKGREEGFYEGEVKGIITGIQKGKEEGMLEGQLETAIRMLKDGFSSENVAKYTGLSLDEINEVKENLN